MTIHIHLTLGNILFTVLLSGIFLKLALTLVRNALLVWYARDCEQLIQIQHRWRKLIRHDQT